MSSSNLRAKHLVVTGGGGRLGSRIVRHFASAGARVTAVVISEAESTRVPPGDTVVIRRADVTDAASVDETFRKIADEFGQIDALVHTIGMWTASPFAETDPASWEQIIGVNLTSTFLCFKAAIRNINGVGTLIALSSRQGADAGVARQGAYSVSKAGVVRLVEAVAAEYDGRIRAHAIAPSTILFDEDGHGVQASELVQLIEYLIVNGTALNGETIRAYGTG